MINFFATVLVDQEKEQSGRECHFHANNLAIVVYSLPTPKMIYTKSITLN